MMFKNFCFLCSYFLLLFQTNFALPLAEQLKKDGYVEICNNQLSRENFNSLYNHFDELIFFLQTNPIWTQKLHIAKERFLRTKHRNYYSTDFFGFYDESQKGKRGQISFYYSIDLDDFICHYYPEIVQIPQIFNFFKSCRNIHNSCFCLIKEAVTALDLETLYSTNQPPILIKIIKYLPSYLATKPHYDGTAFSIFLDSTNNDALLLSPYKTSYLKEDFTSPLREFSQLPNQSSNLLIPGALLTEFSIYPTPHIVTQSGNTRYATIAFAMRPYFEQKKIELTPLPNLKD
ncbi:MAG: hypothetical protein BGO10_06675 [Chlamydia sp. 32-24]|nr:MAG: hypothetical protein BGO10_06675 [Chlamydia sp. 32-24]